MDTLDVVAWDVFLIDGKDRYQTVVMGKKRPKCGQWLLLAEQIGYYPHIVSSHRHEHTANHALFAVLRNPLVWITQILLPSDSRIRFFVAAVRKCP
jgi:hypothetical protein